MRSPVRVGVLVACAVLAVTACTFDRQVIAVPPSEVVVHAVLDPGDTLVDVLVERSLSGTITVHNERFDPLDPINTAGGVPARGAQVSITGPNGTAQGFEGVYPGKPSGYGGGRYLFRRFTVHEGARYTLNVRTADGIVVTGSTVVPGPIFTPSSNPLVPFRRDRDTIALAWATAPIARTYGVRIESPFGAFQLFTDTAHVTLAGNLRNVFASDLPRVFIPGFAQAITIYAADTNFFDYYRSRNDPFTGSGIINRLEGGIGLFASTVMVSTRTVDVTQAITDSSLEGEYQIVEGGATALLSVGILQLYVETPASSTVGASLSGWYLSQRTAGARAGMVGSRDGDRIELQFLSKQDAQDRMTTFVGKQSHDSLIGTLSNASGPVAFRKRPTP